VFGEMRGATAGIEGSALVVRPGGTGDFRTPSFTVTVHGSALLFATRLLVTLGIQLPLGAALLFTRHGILFLATFLVPLVFVQIQCRSRVVAEGLGISWLGCEQLIPFEALAAYSVGPDPRRWVLGPRAPALTLTRRKGSRLLLFGKLSELEALGAGIDQARTERALTAR
jgi:hypothetical protein